MQKATAYMHRCCASEFFPSSVNDTDNLWLEIHCGAYFGKCLSGPAVDRPAKSISLIDNSQ